MRMNQYLWKTISDFFSPAEAWGDPNQMQWQIMEPLYQFRLHIKRPIIIHCGFEHRATGGYHPQGLAVDLHIPGMHVIDAFLAASRFHRFTGIGVYSLSVWNNPGLHLDARPTKPRSTWGCLEKGKYVPLDRNFLQSLL